MEYSKLLCGRDRLQILAEQNALGYASKSLSKSTGSMIIFFRLAGVVDWRRQCRKNRIPEGPDEDHKGPTSELVVPATAEPPDAEAEANCLACREDDLRRYGRYSLNEPQREQKEKKKKSQLHAIPETGTVPPGGGGCQGGEGDINRLSRTEDN